MPLIEHLLEKEHEETERSWRSFKVREQYNKRLKRNALRKRPPKTQFLAMYLSYKEEGKIKKCKVLSERFEKLYNMKLRDYAEEVIKR